MKRVCVSKGKEQRLRMASRRKARWMRCEDGVGVMGVSRSDILCWCAAPVWDWRSGCSRFDGSDGFRVRCGLASQ